MFIASHTHKHTNTHIYIYIYQFVTMLSRALRGIRKKIELENTPAAQGSFQNQSCKNIKIVKCATFRIWQRILHGQPSRSCLIRCTNIKWVQRVLLTRRSRQFRPQTARRTARRTDEQDETTGTKYLGCFVYHHCLYTLYECMHTTRGFLCLVLYSSSNWQQYVFLTKHN